MKRKGGITVFLTLMLSILATFITALATKAQEYVERSEAEYAVDCAVRSCFSEYDRELYDSYGILLIDSSYKSGESGIERVGEHFAMYLTNSLTANELLDVTVSDMGDDPAGYFSSLEFTATFKGRSGKTYSITREYSYDEDV